MPGGQQSLTVVIPVHNQAREIGATLRALDEAVVRSGFAARVVVVDDGSTDGTAAAARAAGIATPLHVVEQANRGRFEARRRGLAEADGTYCLLLDSRVRLDPDALRFVHEHLDGAGGEVWNGHVEIETGEGPYAVFWDVLTRFVFRAYFRDPRRTSFGADELERYPTGTGCLFAPRDALVAAFDAFRSAYGDLRHANDDAPVFRSLARGRRINIAPGFGCRYSARTALVPFLRHSFHRGAVFVDGYGRPESSWFPIVVALYAGSAGCLLAARRSRAPLAAAAAAAAAGGAALALAEGRPEDAPTMAWVTPLYAAAHVAGMWRALGLLARVRRAP